MKVLGNSMFAITTALILLVTGGTATADDVVEFLDGTTVTGTITSIRKAEREFNFASGSGSTTKVYPFEDVHGVTYKGKWYELTPKNASAPTDPSGSDGIPKRTKAEVLAIINSAGQSPPDWFEATPLDYPKTLDLSWPMKAPSGPWQSNKNMGQYIWSVINENPGRWHSGIKLLHHCLALHKDDRVLLKRDMNALGAAYFRLLQDYPRAAFWFQRGQATVRRVANSRQSGLSRTHAIVVLHSHTWHGRTFEADRSCRNPFRQTRR